MKVFAWNEEKNRRLLLERGISFDEIFDTVVNNGYFDNISHVNPRKYRGQRLMIILYNEYVYLVPYMRTGNKFFLKTIYPSRKFTKLHRSLKLEGYEKTKTRL